MYEAVIAVIDCVNHYAPALTFVATSCGVAAAIAAAIQAKQLLKAGREADRNQNRAYLTVSKCEIMLMRNRLARLDTGPAEAYLIRIEVKNTGATPAEWYNARCTVRLDVSDEASEEGMIRSFTEETPRWAGMAAGEAATFILTEREAFELLAIAASPQNGDCAVYLDCHLQYKTMLDEQPMDWRVSLATYGSDILQYRRKQRQKWASETIFEEPDEPLRMRFIPREPDN